MTGTSTVYAAGARFLYALDAATGAVVWKTEIGPKDTAHSLSIVHLSGSLAPLQAWQAPGTAGGGQDWDFGSSPTLFGGLGIPPDVGACNKDGQYYALAANPLGSSPLWADTIGAPAGPAGSCLASAVWNGPAGSILTALPAGSSRVFAQPVFAQGGLFVATETQGGYDFAP